MPILIFEGLKKSNNGILLTFVLALLAGTPGQGVCLHIVPPLDEPGECPDCKTGGKEPNGL